MPSTNFMLRGLTEYELAQLDAMAHNARSSRQEYVLTLVREHIGTHRPQPVAVVEIAPLATCQRCGEAPANRLVYFNTGAFSWRCEDCVN